VIVCFITNHYTTKAALLLIISMWESGLCMIGKSHIILGTGCSLVATLFRTLMSA